MEIERGGHLQRGHKKEIEARIRRFVAAAASPQYPPPEVAPINRVIHFEISADDVPRAVAFYKKAFG